MDFGVVKGSNNLLIFCMLFFNSKFKFSKAKQWD